MPDILINQSAVTATPAATTIAGAQDFELLSVQATFDGSGAGSPFTPTLELVGPAGQVMARIPATLVAAAGSAEVSWFPGINPSTATVNPVISNQLDYVEITAPVTILPANTSANQKVIIASNPLVFDGATRVRIEVFTPVFDIASCNNFIIDLWDNTTDLGRLGQLDLDPNPTDLGAPLYLARYYTPPAGTHTFRIKGWTTGVAGSDEFTAGVGGILPGPDPNYLPGWLRVST